MRNPSPLRASTTVKQSYPGSASAHDALLLSSTTIATLPPEYRQVGCSQSQSTVRPRSPVIRVSQPASSNALSSSMRVPIGLSRSSPDEAISRLGLRTPPRKGNQHFLANNTHGDEVSGSIGSYAELGPQIARDPQDMSGMTGRVGRPVSLASWAGMGAPSAAASIASRNGSIEPEPSESRVRVVASMALPPRQTSPQFGGARVVTSQPQSRGFESPPAVEQTQTNASFNGGLPSIKELIQASSTRASPVGSAEENKAQNGLPNQGPDDGTFIYSSQAPVTTTSACEHFATASYRSRGNTDYIDNMSGKPAAQPVIALDVDEVLCCYVDGFRKFMQRHVPSSPLDTDTVFREAHNPHSQLRLQFALGGGLDNLEAVPGSVAALRKLRAAGVRLEAVTSRPPIMRESTEALLLKLFPAGTFSAAHFVGPGEKGRTCNAINAFAIVDDQIPNVIDAAECGVVAILFDLCGSYPWSRCEPHELPPPIQRFETWAATCDFLLSFLPEVYSSLPDTSRMNDGRSHTGTLTNAYGDAPVADVVPMSSAPILASSLDRSTRPLSDTGVTSLDSQGRLAPRPVPYPANSSSQIQRFEQATAVKSVPTRSRLAESRSEDQSYGLPSDRQAPAYAPTYLLDRQPYSGSPVARATFENGYQHNPAATYSHLRNAAPAGQPPPKEDDGMMCVIQ